MKNKSTTTPENADRARFLDRATAVAETTPVAVTLMLAAGIKRLSVTPGSKQDFDERA